MSRMIVLIGKYKLLIFLRDVALINIDVVLSKVFLDQVSDGDSFGQDGLQQVSGNRLSDQIEPLIAKKAKKNPAGAKHVEPRPANF